MIFIRKDKRTFEILKREKIGNLSCDMCKSKAASHITCEYLEQKTYKISPPFYVRVVCEDHAYIIVFLRFLNFNTNSIWDS